MQKEFIRETNSSVTLNVTAGKIDSFRQLEKTTGTVRVYENGCVGVAGCLGEPDEEKLTERAKEALSFGIPYPESLEGPLEKEELREEEILPVPDFIPTMQTFLDRLGKLCPGFALSNKVRLQYERSEYSNSKGRRLVCSGRALSIELIAQNRGSGNLFDTFLVWGGDSFDEEEVLSHFKKQYDAFYRPAQLEPGRYPVLFDVSYDPSALYGSYLPHFSGDMYAAGASLLSGKLGQKVFSDKLTLRDDRDPASALTSCFFDAEGCVAPGYRPTFVENGVLTGLLTTKKTAKEYGLPNFGSASAAYDGVPEPGINRLYPEPTAKSLRELVPGKAVYVVVASGGDVTPDGHFASPVQMAYLMEDGELAGRLPAISVSGSFFELFGRDYLGTVHGDPLSRSIMSAFTMDVERI